MNNRYGNRFHLPYLMNYRKLLCASHDLGDPQISQPSAIEKCDHEKSTLVDTLEQLSLSCFGPVSCGRCPRVLHTESDFFQIRQISPSSRGIDARVMADS
jgi:hypothetical protein